MLEAAKILFVRVVGYNLMDHRWSGDIRKEIGIEIIVTTIEKLN